MITLPGGLSSSEKVWQFLKYCLDPINGYTGTLVIGQFWVGLVPGEVKTQYDNKYGSIYDQTGARLDELHSADEDGDLTRQYNQRVQLSVWASTHPVAGAIARELLLRMNEVSDEGLPLMFPDAQVTNLECSNEMTVMEARDLWMSVFDITLEFQR